MRRINFLTLATTCLVAFACKDGSLPPTAVLPNMHISRVVVAAPAISAQVSAGGWHTCALKTDGSVVCWGNNGEGESAVPAGLAPTVNITTGQFSTCAASTAGTVACWGDNYYGESTPPALTGAVQVAAGLYHACARISDGTVQCWGRADEGETAPPPGLSGVTQISAGGLHSCALTGGTVVCWGDNSYNETATPAGLSGVTQFSTGRYHTCAIVASAVTCWGDNSAGESTVPAGLGAVTQVSAGLAMHTCALISNGTVTCWGDNSYGQATPPAGLTGVTQISSGQYHSCALKSDFSIVCWGSAGSGQISIPANLNLFVVLSQVIGFNTIAPSPAYTGTTYAVSAAASSGLPVTLKTLTPSVCSLTGNTVSFLTAGTCTIAADQAGDLGHLPAPELTQSITVTVLRVAQTITITSSAPSPAYVGSSYTISAASTSGLAATFTSLTTAICSVAGNNATFLAAGTCTVAADQAGDATHLAAPQKTQAITVTVPLQLSQAITFRTAPPATANAGDKLEISATGGASGNPVVLSSLTPANCTVRGNTVSFIHIGACTIAENQAGNAAYSAAPTKTATINVIWAFRGFLDDVVNPPNVNTVNSGQSIPVKFKLGGNAGSNIYAAGSPYSTAASCTDWSVTGPPVAAKTANGHDDKNENDVNNDNSDGDVVYNYVWKTDDSWAKTCRIFTVVLLDGTSHSARFNFHK